MNSLLSAGRSLLQAVLPACSARRFKGFRHPGGRRYPGGILYYPRFPKEEEPVVEPSKLFRVERIRPIKGTTKSQRRILHLFHVGTVGQTISVVKNTPENNASLWKVKHLIRLAPIVFPYGEPTINDIKHTILKENGECIVTKELVVEDERVEAWDNFNNNPGKMDGETVKKHARLKWLSAYGGGY